MRRIALTGGIATGKTYVLDRIRTRGVPCVDADELAHGVTGSGTEATAAISKRFGPGVLGPDGAVDRPTLGRIVFADPDARRDLEAIVHPAVYRAVEAALRGFAMLGAPLAVAAIPLLDETGHHASFDAVVATVCSPAMQLRRLVARGLSEDESRRRIAAQMPAAEKASRADYVIDTETTFDETDAQIARVLAALSSAT